MKHKKSVYTTFTLISQLGISVIVPVFLCTFIGMKIDEHFSTSITVPLMILGVLSGGRSAYVLAKNAINMMEKETAEDEYWKIRKQIQKSKKESKKDQKKKENKESE